MCMIQSRLRKDYISLIEAADTLGVNMAWFREKRGQNPEDYPPIHRDGHAHNSKIYFKRKEFMAWFKKRKKDKE